MLNNETNALAEKNKQDYNSINTWVRPKIKHPSIKSIIERVKPKSRQASFKEIFLKKLRVIMGPLAMKMREDEHEPTMEEAFSYLGQATARLALLEELSRVLRRDGFLSVFPMHMGTDSMLDAMRECGLFCLRDRYGPPGFKAASEILNFDKCQPPQ